MKSLDSLFPTRRMVVSHALESGWMPLTDAARLCNLTRQRLHKVTQDGQLRVRRESVSNCSRPLLLVRQTDVASLIEERGRTPPADVAANVAVLPLRFAEQRYALERRGYLPLMDAAKAAGVKHGRLRAAIYRGLLPCERIQRAEHAALFVKMKDVEAYLVRPTSHRPKDSSTTGNSAAP